MPRHRNLSLPENPSRALRFQSSRNNDRPPFGVANSAHWLFTKLTFRSRSNTYRTSFVATWRGRSSGGTSTITRDTSTRVDPRFRDIGSGGEGWAPPVDPPPGPGRRQGARLPPPIRGELDVTQGASRSVDTRPVTARRVSIVQEASKPLTGVERFFGDDEIIGDSANKGRCLVASNADN